MRRPIQLAIIIFAILPFVAFADYGTGALDIICDSKSDLLKINTYIKWDKDYDTFMEKHPDGFVINKKGAEFLLDAAKDSVDYSCSLKNSSFIETINQHGP